MNFLNNAANIALKNCLNLKQTESLLIIYDNKKNDIAVTEKSVSNVYVFVIKLNRIRNG